MPPLTEGPATPLFTPVSLRGDVGFSQLHKCDVSSEMIETAPEHAPSGSCVFWGIDFRIGKVLCLKDRPLSRKLKPLRIQWLVFMHTIDWHPQLETIQLPMRGEGLNDHIADYVMIYADGTEERVEIRRIQQIAAFRQHWGENCFQGVAHRAPFPMPALHEQPDWGMGWGGTQMRAGMADNGPWTNWLWAWENPHPRKALVGLRFEPRGVPVVISAVSAGKASSQPLRWEPRQKAVLRLPKGVAFDPTLDKVGLLKQIQMDMGTVISARPRPLYPQESWAKSNEQLAPSLSDRELLIEYTAHPDARFYLTGGKTVPVATLVRRNKSGPLRVIPPARQRVQLRVVEAGSGKPVPVKLHIHGEAGEYLPPTDRHRIPNPAWIEDYSCDLVYDKTHFCTYIHGETFLNLPLGRIYVEVTKGLEIRPIRKVVQVTGRTRKITLRVKKVLPWREGGWVSADTHVHTLSPMAALLEGAGEGVNVVNLLATQLGEMISNVADFDGKTTFGSTEAGGDGEHMVRVGTENRQHLMGHISLLGYKGPIIEPVGSGMPNETALGDPIEVLLTEWAQRCKEQDGLVVLPHFPCPRGENPVTIVTGNADAVEVKCRPLPYHGIDPYSLSSWYTYLNCGYLLAAVGGTDKMCAAVPVGQIRTYARIRPDEAFTYEAWKDAVRRADTFVTYGPLVEFAVEGQPAGSWVDMPRGGGTVDVTWEAASVTTPMHSVELIINGEVRDGRTTRRWSDQGCFTTKVDRSSWIALLIRGQYACYPEIIAAHTSPVMVRVKGSEFYSAVDAVTILEQIEGVLAHFDTVGTRAEDREYKRMRLILTGAHRKLHNRMHQMGHFHEHSATTDHAEHH